MKNTADFESHVLQVMQAIRSWQFLRLGWSEAVAMANVSPAGVKILERIPAHPADSNLREMAERAVAA